jgi:1-acyl-sn-glycerol-3-phosphate acyltransferase
MPRPRAIYVAAQLFLRAFAHLFFGLRVSGLEHVPPQGCFLVAANHKSYLDPPFLGAALPRELHYFAKRQLFDLPLFGALIRVYGAVPVNREGFDRRSVSAALEILERGDGLLVFPEGTRIRRRGLAEPKEGIGMLALRSGAPVVPAFIASTWEPRRRWYRRVPIVIRFGPALRFDRVRAGPAARERYGEIAREVMERIRELGERD